MLTRRTHRSKPNRRWNCSANIWEKMNMILNLRPTIWRLDKTLTQFYAQSRDKNGEMYKKTTLTSYRQSIQRHLDAMRDDKIDIVKGNEFSTSAKVFGGVVKQIKWEGKAAVDHHQFISDADSEVLYAHFDFWRTSDPAQILQHKENWVNFVCFFFMIRLIKKMKLKTIYKMYLSIWSKINLWIHLNLATVLDALY
jgi:hypothetical protein